MNHTQPTILQQIVLDKAKWVENKQRELPLEQVKATLRPSDRDFYHALAQGSHQTPAYILECKKASPSKGLIRADFDLNAIATVYKQYASAISVLTDEQYFQGDFRYIQQVRQQVSQPILCKDFMISAYQVYLARYYQADAILLMLSVVDDQTYRELRDLAHSLGMGVLTETSNEQEFERALALGAKIIGVNNRNLHDLSIDLQRTARLVQQFAAKIPENVRIISESGIHSHQQVQRIQTVAHGFLIGSSLMGNADLNNAVRAILFGENKVCGLTRAQDVISAYQQGALYGGLIFAEKSPRRLSLRQAQELVVQAPLRFVGVFQNQPLEHIVQLARQLNLYAVQLHGEENDEFIQQLAAQLGEKTQIWKALSFERHATHPVEVTDNPLIARYVLDTAQGGSGVAFDWSAIPAHLKAKSLLAGGLNTENLPQALAQHCLGVDLNSGVEQRPGVKDPQKLAQAFALIRPYKQPG